MQKRAEAKCRRNAGPCPGQFIARFCGRIAAQAFGTTGSTTGGEGSDADILPWQLVVQPPGVCVAQRWPQNRPAGPIDFSSASPVASRPQGRGRAGVEFQPIGGRLELAIANEADFHRRRRRGISQVEDGSGLGAAGDGLDGRLYVGQRLRVVAGPKRHRAGGQPHFQVVPAGLVLQEVFDKLSEAGKRPASISPSETVSSTAA